MEKDRNRLVDLIERRFQFVLILTVFLPTVWERVGTEITKLAPNVNPDSFLWSMVFMIFLSYIFVQITQETIKTIYLVSMEVVLITLAYFLVMVVGIAMATLSTASWSLIIFGLGTLVIPILILLIFGISLAGLVDNLIVYWKNRRQLITTDHA